MKTFLCALLLASNSAFSAQVLTFSELKNLSEKTTGQYAFDEAINISPNFGVSQVDPDLKPYFNKTTGRSELCVPTSFAHYLIYQMGVSKKLPISTKVPGVSKDLKTIDANALVIALSKKCKTDYNTGTNNNNFMACIGEVFDEYYGKTVSVKRIIKADSVVNPDYVEWENRKPDLTDIREALKEGAPVLATINWNNIDPKTNKWAYIGGHAIGIYGYSWEEYFENNILQLDIMDPLYIWTTSKDTSVFNMATAIRRRDAEDSSLFIDGRGFNGQSSRGFFGSLTIIKFE